MQVHEHQTKDGCIPHGQEINFPSYNY